MNPQNTKVVEHKISNYDMIKAAFIIIFFFLQNDWMNESFENETIFF